MADYSAEEELKAGAVNLGTVKILAATRDAMLILQLSSDERAWIPRSQIHPDSEALGEDGEGVLFVSDWFHEKIEWK